MAGKSDYEERCMYMWVWGTEDPPLYIEYGLSPWKKEVEEIQESTMCFNCESLRWKMDDAHLK
jgi:hypothetical protein